MKDAKKIIILGVGGNSIDILDTINEINSHGGYQYECIGFLDDHHFNLDKIFYGVKVLGPLKTAKNFSSAHFINGIASPNTFWNKESIIAKTNLSADKFITIVHPNTAVSKMATLGFGTVVFQNVSIAPNVKIGNHVMILPNTVISHDVAIGDYTSITGGVCISGGVTIGKSCYLGTNCSIIGDIIIGDYSLIGMGGVVLESVPKESIYVGNPAKFLRKIKT